MEKRFLFNSFIAIVALVFFCVACNGGGGGSGGGGGTSPGTEEVEIVRETVSQNHERPLSYVFAEWFRGIKRVKIVSNGGSAEEAAEAEAKEEGMDAASSGEAYAAILAKNPKLWDSIPQDKTAFWRGFGQEVALYVVQTADMVIFDKVAQIGIGFSETRDVILEYHGTMTAGAEVFGSWDYDGSWSRISIWIPNSMSRDQIMWIWSWLLCFERGRSLPAMPTMLAAPAGTPGQVWENPLIRELEKDNTIGVYLNVSYPERGAIVVSSYNGTVLPTDLADPVWRRAAWALAHQNVVSSSDWWGYKGDWDNVAAPILTASPEIFEWLAQFIFNLYGIYPEQKEKAGASYVSMEFPDLGGLKISYSFDNFSALQPSEGGDIKEKFLDMLALFLVGPAGNNYKGFVNLGIPNP